MPGLQGTPTTSEDESDDPQPEMPTPTQQDLGWADGGAEDEAQAIEMARREMEMVLQDADSLETVGALKKSYGRVRGHLDSQIMRILQSKIDESEDWVKLFKRTFKFTGGEITGEFLLSLGYLPGTHRGDCPVATRILAESPPWARDDLQGSAGGGPPPEGSTDT